ncbi:uncharacterized protein BT62DRAFT_1002033 [Guyanagaster necrorhizus]|uniref:Uncharacterized protein n=1 Tax=Guyanagaster necrorhizus TaxID=856835 RepID=A0A9P7VYV4_9AGAR|nr:uncharacterized protein BT62DRAFT_1002033 [Guyanagaster necrorhizus MCA 3950]KAG7449713.1 hypothetical protein BT62DRAFT_1002033 [Guyanagaster necrorhizus MCA 3950]
MMISVRVFFILFIAFMLSFAITAQASPAPIPNPIDGLQPYVAAKNHLGLGNGNNTLALSETNSAEVFSQSWTAIIFVVVAAVWNIQFA